MPLDITPGNIPTPSRDDVVAKYKRDYALRNPNVSSTDALVDADARAFADGVMPLYANSVTIGNNVVRTRATGAALTQWSLALGGGGRLGASGAIGFVTAGPGTAAGGTTIFVKDEIKFGSLRYTCLLTGTYKAGDPVPVQGVDTGPGSNQPAGAIGTWTSPRPGSDPTAVVLAQSDGTGLSGGHGIETDDELQARLDYIESTPAASGNEAQYIQAAVTAPGVPVGAAFAYPGILGPGTVGIIFTLRATVLGASRIPNAAQIAVVLAWLTGKFPGSDGIFVGTLVAQQTSVAFNVAWTAASPGWTDLAPWPPFSTTGNRVQVTVDVTATATHFSLDTSGTSAGGAQVAPSVGATIGFFDAANQVFRRKRVLSVVAHPTWADVTCDTTNGISDTSFVPYVGQFASPWSDSLNAIIAPVQGYFDALGPGEQVASFFDPGLRQRRSPASPGTSPSVVLNKIAALVDALPVVQDATLIFPTATPLAPTVGTPGISANVFTLQNIAAFAG